MQPRCQGVAGSEGSEYPGTQTQNSNSPSNMEAPIVREGAFRPPPRISPNELVPVCGSFRPLPLRAHKKAPVPQIGGFHSKVLSGPMTLGRRVACA